MRIWVHHENIPSVKCLVPKSKPEEDQLVGFHLSIPIGYVESATLFCATTKTIKYWTLETLPMRNTVPPRHLDNLVETNPPQTYEAEEAVAEWFPLGYPGVAMALCCAWGGFQVSNI